MQVTQHACEGGFQDRLESPRWSPLGPGDESSEKSEFVNSSEDISSATGHKLIKKSINGIL